MAFSAGVFSLVAGNPVVTGTTISSTWANNTLSDIASNGLSMCMLKDGSQTITANIPMGGFKFTGLATGTAAGNSVRYEQVFTTTTLTDAATIAWNAALAPMATVTITASRAVGAPTGLVAGGVYSLIVTQDGSGGWTLTWNAVFKAQGGGTMPQPETTAGAITGFVFYTPDGTNLYNIQCTPFMDTNYFVRGASDPTKKVRMEVDGLTTGTTRVLTVQDRDLTIGNVMGTEQASTSGTAIDFVVPTWATSITVQFVGVSTSGNSIVLVQIGDAGGIEATGYLSVLSTVDTGAASTALTTGFGATGGGGTAVYHGSLTITLEDVTGFTWVSSGVLSRSDTAQTVLVSGSKSLSAALTQLRITTVNGTDTFDAGAVNILYS